MQQIIILRKLQIPVKQICAIMDHPAAAEAADIFRRHISDLDSETTALSIVRSILDDFVNRLTQIAGLQLNLDFLQDGAVMQLTRSLPLAQRNAREGAALGDMGRAAGVWNKLRNVRIVYLPPMSVASAFFVGEDGFLTYLGLQDWINESGQYQYDYDGNVSRCQPPIREIDSFGGTELEPEEILNLPEDEADSNSTVYCWYPVK